MPDFDAFRCLAVVGARQHSEYGKKACEMLVAGLKGYPIMIISGLANGIDSVAHQAALQNDLLTIAVPGSGLEEKVIYPKSKLPLAREIIKKGGCLLSEYDSQELTGPWTFPERNRVMAGLCDAALIIEATRRSGTSITARLALDYNKDVLAVPGSVFSELSEGPHFLMKLGATPVTTSRDIVEALGLEWKDAEEENSNEPKEKRSTLFNQCSPQEKELLALLPSTRDALIRALISPAHEIQTCLSLLEIKGLIKEDAGKIYAL
jgi:DNA processing protein